MTLNLNKDLPFSSVTIEGEARYRPQQLTLKVPEVKVPSWPVVCFTLRYIRRAQEVCGPTCLASGALVRPAFRSQEKGEK